MRKNTEILTPKEVIKYLRISMRTLYRWVSERRIPAFKVGGSWRFRKSEIDKWMERNRNKSVS